MVLVINGFAMVVVFVVAVVFVVTFGRNGVVAGTRQSWYATMIVMLVIMNTSSEKISVKESSNTLTLIMFHFNHPHHLISHVNLSSGGLDEGRVCVWDREAGMEIDQLEGR